MSTSGSFRFFPPDYDYSIGKPHAKVDVDWTSFQRVAINKSVNNIRGREKEFADVDTAGFAVANYPTKVPLNAFFDKDDATVRGDYYKEVEELLKKKLGASKVQIFDHTIRQRDPNSARQPVQQVHVDQTPRAAEARVRRHLPGEEAERLLKKRVQLINVWRPLGAPAVDFPLALIDFRTTEPSDLVPVDLLYPDRGENGAQDDDDRGKEVLPDKNSVNNIEGYKVKGETYAVAHSEGQQVFYYKDMTPEEVILIKCYDSAGKGLPNGKDEIAALAPHTAFEDPNTPKGTPGRRSIEVRCLVFYD